MVRRCSKNLYEAPRAAIAFLQASAVTWATAWNEKANRLRATSRFARVVAKQLESGGFSRKQAVAAAEVLAELLDERSTKGAVREAIEVAVYGLDQRRQADTTAIRADIVVQGEAISRQGEVVARLEGLLVKVLEGQAVLHQNDMELKRRLDER
jgi:hypothetical protein